MQKRRATDGDRQFPKGAQRIRRENSRPQQKIFKFSKEMKQLSTIP